MGHFIIENFYLFFQGILLFQVFFFGMIFSITKRKEILYYCLFILAQLCYFFINAPKTFFNIEEDIIFNSEWYLNINYLLILFGNLFYLVFLNTIFKRDNKGEVIMTKMIQYSISLLPILMVLFLVFPFFKLPRSPIFYLAILISIPASIYIIYINYRLAEGFQSLIIKGIVCNILGTVVTAIMIDRYNKGIREFAFDDYPLLYMRIGILADVFFYQLAILRKWYDQEKLLATKDIQSKLDISNLKNQISRDLHDDVGTTLSKINLQSFMAQTKLDDETFEVKSTLQSIQYEAQGLIKRIKNLIWSIDEVTQDFSLLAHLEDYGRAMCESKNIHFNVYNAFDHLENTGIGVKYNLLMICREAINNSVKYSKAQSLSITFEKEDKQLHLKIIDDGIGINQKINEDGQGLKNMTHRTQQLNGKITFTSKNGVQIHLCIPL